MLAMPGNARIFVCEHPVNMIKGFEGLSAEIELNFSEEITTGSYFAFINKKKDRIKVLYWDVDGLVIWYKRLEKGKYSTKYWNKILMSRREFFMMLEGITPKKIQPRYNVV